MSDHFEIFRHVRRKSNHSEILMSGYGDFTGQFDPIEYEQVEGFPVITDVYYLNTDEKAQLFALFLSLPTIYRAAFYGLVVRMNHAMLYGDYEAAGYMLEQTYAPNELIPVKHQALEYFNIIYKSSALTFTDSVTDGVESE